MPKRCTGVLNDGMNRTPRRALTLVLSLVLMVFSICQAQARVHVPAGAPDTMAHASHDMHAGHEQPPADCHSDCQHLSSHPDAGQPHAMPAVDPVLLAWLPPEPPLDAVTQRALAYHPPNPAMADPPQLLRFQHFLN